MTTKHPTGAAYWANPAAHGRRGAATKHTPGPWREGFRITEEGNRYSVVAGQPGNRRRIGEAHGNTDEEAQANAARIVACVNACEGIADPGGMAEAMAVAIEIHARTRGLSHDHLGDVHNTTWGRFPAKDCLHCRLGAAIAKAKGAD